MLPKQTYHPFITKAFYLQILPENLLIEIPRTTKYDWQNKPQASPFAIHGF